MLLIGLLLGLFAFGSGSPAEAQAPPPQPGPTCAPEAEAAELAVPSGKDEVLCYAPSSEVEASAASTITLAKTVGTDADSCAAQPSVDVISGTEVFYCYTVQNTGQVTVSVHDLEDDRLGALLTDYEYVLAPGATTAITASATISEDTVNIATWTASDGIDSSSSVASATVNVVEATVPGAPAITSVAAAEGEIAVSWTAPADPGSSPITEYVVTPYVGATPATPVTVAASETSATLTGLDNGTTYTVRVAATNDAGTGPESAASDAVTPQWWLPWSSGTVAVTELFTWFTGSPPTGPELAAWLGDLDAGNALPGDLVAALRVNADATKNVDPTTRLYAAYFLRIPDKGGLSFWLNRRRSGWTLSRISNNFAGSSEFRTTYGSLTNRQFVQLVYRNVLDREGEPTGVDYWTNQLNTGRRSRGQVMLNFSDSNEYKTAQVDEVNAAVVYIFLVGRSPSLSERDAFVDELGSTTLAAIVRSLIHQPSFADRAG